MELSSSDQRIKHSTISIEEVKRMLDALVEKCAQECEWEAVNYKRAGGSSKGAAEACAARIRKLAGH